MKGLLGFVWETLQTVLIALAIVLPIRYFVFQPFIVKGSSMEPNFQTGNYLVIDELSYRLRDVRRGEIIVFKYPKNTTQRYIKRVIGLPGETLEIKSGKVDVLDGQGRPLVLQENTYLPENETTPGNLKLTLGPDEYFVLGDNRLASSDSRAWGLLPKNLIIGRVAFRLWPPEEFEVFAAPIIKTLHP